MIQDTATLTPARKRLIRLAFYRSKREPGIDQMVWIRSLPSFQGISDSQIQAWANLLRPKPVPLSDAEIDRIADPGTTGEWYSPRSIAAGLDIPLGRVMGWIEFGWLSRELMYSAADIRTFFRQHPMEIKHRDLSEASWLWLVSVLAGSREQGATA